MARNRSKLTLDAIWDLEDQYTALAGSASSGRMAVASRTEAAAAPAIREAAPETISRTEEGIQTFAEPIKAGLAKGGLYRAKAKKLGTGELKAKKPKVVPETKGQRRSKAG